jgi:hypothetical protein
MSSAVAMLLQVWQHCVATLIIISGRREQALETDTVAQTESNYCRHNPERPVRRSNICGNNNKQAKAKSHQSESLSLWQITISLFLILLFIWRFWMHFSQ